MISSRIWIRHYQRRPRSETTNTLYGTNKGRMRSDLDAATSRRPDVAHPQGKAHHWTVGEPSTQWPVDPSVSRLFFGIWLLRIDLSGHRAFLSVAVAAVDR